MMMVVAREGASSMEVLDGRQAPSSPDHAEGQSHLNMSSPSASWGVFSPSEGPTPPAPPPPTHQQPTPQAEGYWNMHLEVLSKLKGEVKDWYEGEGLDAGLGQGAAVKQEQDYGPYTHLHQHHPMTPESMHGGSLNGPLGGPHTSPHMGYPLQQTQQQHQQHYQGYPSHGGMGDLPPMSPGYQRPHPQQHMTQQHMGQHMQYEQQQYGQYGQMGHMGQGMQGHPGHEGPPGREGDPYSFVDEYSGPPPRPVEEVLGTTQPKRRGRKPKHIKLMENGLTPAPHSSGDPLAIAAAQAAHEAKKRKWKQLGPDGKPILAPIKQRKKVDRFDGIPEDEVSKRTLPDHLGPNLDIVIIGINPGLFAAYKGHHYAGPGNHFWKCLYLSGLIPEPLTSEDDFRLLEHGIGFTNIVARTTRGSADLTRKEIKEGGQILLSKLQQFQPRIAVFNGKGIYEIFSGKKEFSFGRQPEKIEGTRTHVWVMPSSSARCAQLPRALDKVPFYTALRKFRDFLKGTLKELNEEEITFINAKVKNLKMEVPDKMELGCEARCEPQPGELCRPGELPPMGSPCPEEDRLVIKEEVDLPTKLEGELEEEEITKEIPQTLFNLNGMTREQLDCMECPTIPIRKKRGRPKKTPDDPNAPPRPRPRPISTDPLMFNGEQPMKKKRGRPKKVLEDGSIPTPKRPGRKPKALKEMLAQQPPQHLLHNPQLGQHPQLAQQQLGQQQPPVGLAHINGMMSPAGYSPNPGAQTFSPQYGGHTPVHGGGSLTPNHTAPATHNPAMVPRGPTPQQFGQSPGYSPGPHHQHQQLPPRPPAYPHQVGEPGGELKVDEEHHLGLSSPPASPLMAQPDFEPPSSMPEGDLSIGASDTQSSAALTPGHQEEPGKTPLPLASQEQPGPQHTPTMPGHFSNPTTPVDGSSYQNYPSYPSNASSHSPSMAKPAPIHPGQSPTVPAKTDVASKSLSGLESLVDQIPSLNEQETSSQHSAHSNSAPCSNPTTPGPPAPSSAPFSPSHVPPTSSSYQSYPGGSGSQGGGSGYPASHYGSPQSSHPYSPHYSSNSTNLSTNFSVSSLANSSISTTMSYSSAGAYELGGSPQASTSSFSVSSLTSSAPAAPSPSMYSQSYSPAPPAAPGPPPSHSSYPDIMSPSMLAHTPPMGSSFMSSPSLMSSPTPMSSSMGGSSMGAMGALHSSMGMTGSQLPYPYSQYSDTSPGYPPPSHSTFPYPPTAPGFHVPSPRFPYPSPYANSPYTQGYSQNAMLERIKQTSMGMGFGGF
ncbi:trithorax group protein osa-like isoform X2 [Eriocheir sinensis]|uniref:trithorax group protein osa-like isoform X2 n=1 Tax=Eriocheir sinensis TaxID=95602 RepID=UPI0021CA1875|nr:trithorax group protein osa-like isoform X2 [Eriocheir sinensis]